MGGPQGSVFLFTNPPDLTALLSDSLFMVPHSRLLSGLLSDNSTSDVPGTQVPFLIMTLVSVTRPRLKTRPRSFLEDGAVPLSF